MPGLNLREHPYWWGYRYWTNDSFAAFGSPVIRPYSTRVENRAVNKALERLKNQKVDLSVAFFERKRTAQLFTDATEEIARETKRFRRQNGSIWDKVRRINPRLESYPKKWLAFQYGVKPTVSDVFGSLQALNEVETAPRPFRVTVTGEADDSWVEDDRSTYLVKGHPEYPLVIRREDSQRDHVSLTYAMDHPVIATLSALGITNPFSTSWETLPYSFILDWAVPVGGYLNLLDATFGWSFVSGSHGRTMRCIGRGAYVTPTPWGQIEGDSSRLSYEIGEFSRFIYPTSPWPRFPGLENPLKNAGRVANALSLLVSAYR